MNSHSEYDNTQTTCKDCGNIYGTRKSLWVHRQKRHPRIPNPSPCELCDKTFFDKTELFHHLKTHSNDDVFSHLQEMQQQLEAEQENRQKQEQNESGGAERMSCHICGQWFHDKRVLSKHLRLHEQQKKSGSTVGNSPLAAMLADTSLGAEGNGSSSDYNYPSYKGQMVDGQYACDMCPKTFPMINALKVHRGWHFRSPDGRQITDASNIWTPDGVSSSKGKRSRTGKPPVCPYCESTFASGNNLRRHIVEVHKRNEAKMLRENGEIDDTVFIEKELECRACAITYSNRSEWVEHKISHARTMKPSQTYEWGCEICGKIFTRKERLLVHMLVHMTGRDESASQHSGDPQSELGFESNSQSSISSQSHSQQSHDSSNLKAALQRQVNAKQSVSLLKQSPLLTQPQGQKHTSEQESQDQEESNDAVDPAPSYSCDLCQVFFHTAKELGRHVTSHIINGPETNSDSQEQRSQQQQHEEDEDDVQDNEDADDDEEDEEEDDEEDDEEQTAAEQQIDEEYEDDEADENEEAEEAEEVEEADEGDDVDVDEDGDLDDTENVEQSGEEEEEDEEEESDEDDEEDQQPNNNQESRKIETLTGFNCRACGSSSESHIDMIKCMESHKKQTDISCDKCQLYFADNYQLQEHDILCHPFD